MGSSVKIFHRTIARRASERFAAYSAPAATRFSRSTHGRRGSPSSSTGSSAAHCASRAWSISTTDRGTSWSRGCTRCMGSRPPGSSVATLPLPGRSARSGASSDRAPHGTFACLPSADRFQQSWHDGFAESVSSSGGRLVQWCGDTRSLRESTIHRANDREAPAATRSRARRERVVARAESLSRYAPSGWTTRTAARAQTLRVANGTLDHRIR